MISLKNLNKYRLCLSLRFYCKRKPAKRAYFVRESTDSGCYLSYAKRLNALLLTNTRSGLRGPHTKLHVIDSGSLTAVIAKELGICLVFVCICRPSRRVADVVLGHVSKAMDAIFFLRFACSLSCFLFLRTIFFPKLC